MKSKILLSFGLFVGLFLFTQSAVAQGTIGPMNGIVTSSADGRGIGNALVHVVTPNPGLCFGWGGASIRTNPFGYYTIYVHTDCPLLVTVSEKRYASQVRYLTIGEVYNIDFALDPN